MLGLHNDFDETSSYEKEPFAAHSTECRTCALNSSAIVMLEEGGKKKKKKEAISRPVFSCVHYFSEPERTTVFSFPPNMQKTTRENCMCVFVRACARACVRANVCMYARACVRACVRLLARFSWLRSLGFFKRSLVIVLIVSQHESTHQQPRILYYYYVLPPVRVRAPK